MPSVVTSPRALIVGCGYLGSRAGALLASRGFRVTATTTRAERLPAIAELGLEPAILDLAAPGASSIWDAAYEACVYTAAPRGADPRLALRDGAIECARRLLGSPASPGAFIHVSSTGVHALSDGSLIDEESPAEPAEERARLVREAEKGLLALARTDRLQLRILRMGGLYGPGRSPVEWLRDPRMRERVLHGGGEAFMNWVRVEDAARAIVLAIEKGRPGETYIITDGEPVRRGEFYRAAAAAAGLDPPDLPSRPEDLGKRCSIRKARTELGFAPEYPSYREGLAELRDLS